MTYYRGRKGRTQPEGAAQHTAVPDPHGQVCRETQAWDGFPHVVGGPAMFASLGTY